MLSRMEPQTKSPVMDVSAPPTQTVDHPEPVTAPPESEPPKAESKHETKPLQAEKKAKAPAKPAGSNNNVTLAIVATVVIVISLAAIATYAYMQQNP